MATTIKGTDSHAKRLASMKRIRDPMRRALLQAGEAVQEDAQHSIRAGAISGPGHVPSRPGEPPNADTHVLDTSINVRLNPSGLSVSVVAMARYAAALEFGTSRILPRPFMRPALQRNKNRLVLGAVQAVHETVRVYKGDAAFSAARAAYDAGD